MSECFPVALSIGGSDPSGGAGIQADLKTFHQFGVYGAAAITCITVQNTTRVARVEAVSPELVREQIRAVIDDLHPSAIKTGALASAGNVRAVAEAVGSSRLIVDPVMISKHGAPLLSDEGRSVLRQFLLPLAYLAMPNLAEASALTGLEIRTMEDMRRAAAIIAAETGCEAVLVKGGHLDGPAVDVLYRRGEWREYTAERIETRHTHGTGCTYSAAITALLAGGADLPEAVAQAKTWITEAIRTNPGLGAGTGPVNHLAGIPRLKSAPR